MKTDKAVRKGDVVLIDRKRRGPMTVCVGAHPPCDGEHKDCKFVSCDAPIGKALLGREQGEMVTVEMPGGDTVEIKIERIVRQAAKAA